MGREITLAEAREMALAELEAAERRRLDAADEEARQPWSNEWQDHDNRMREGYFLARNSTNPYYRGLAQLADEYNATHEGVESDDYRVDKIGGSWYILGGGKTYITPWHLQHQGYAHKSSAMRRLKQLLASDGRGRCSLCGENNTELAADPMGCPIDSINCRCIQRFPHKPLLPKPLARVVTGNSMSMLDEHHIMVTWRNSFIDSEGNLTPAPPAVVHALKEKARRDRGQQ